MLLYIAHIVSFPFVWYNTFKVLARHWYVYVKGLTLSWNWWLKPFYCPVRQFAAINTVFLVLSASAVWTELVTSQDCRRLKIPRRFCPVSKCGVNWVLSCLTQFPIRYDVTFGNWVKTMRSHRRQDKTVLSAICWKLSATVVNSVHTADKTRQDSLVLSVSAVWTSHY